MCRPRDALKTYCLLDFSCTWVPAGSRQALWQLLLLCLQTMHWAMVGIWTRWPAATASALELPTAVVAVHIFLISSIGSVDGQQHNIEGTMLILYVGGSAAM